MRFRPRRIVYTEYALEEEAQQRERRAFEQIPHDVTLIKNSSEKMNEADDKDSCFEDILTQENIVRELEPSAKKCGYDYERYVLPRPVQIRQALEVFKCACLRSTNFLVVENESYVIFSDDALKTKCNYFQSSCQNHMLYFVNDSPMKQEKDYQDNFLLEALIRRDPELPDSRIIVQKRVETGFKKKLFEMTTICLRLSKVKESMDANDMLGYPSILNTKVQKFANKRCERNKPRDYKTNFANGIFIKNEKISFIPPFDSQRYTATSPSEYQYIDKNEDVVDTGRSEMFEKWLKRRKKIWKLQRILVDSNRKVTAMETMILNDSYIYFRSNKDPVRLDPKLPQLRSTSSLVDESTTDFLELPKPIISQNSDQIQKDLVSSKYFSSRVSTSMPAIAPRRLANYSTRTIVSFDNLVINERSFHLKTSAMLSFDNDELTNGLNGFKRRKSTMQLTVPPKIFRDNPYPATSEESTSEGRILLPSAISCYVPSLNDLNFLANAYFSTRPKESYERKATNAEYSDYVPFKWGPKVLKGFVISHNIVSKSLERCGLSKDYQSTKTSHRGKLSDAIIHGIRSITSGETMKDSQNRMRFYNLVELSTNYPCRSRFQIKAVPPFMYSCDDPKVIENRKKVISLVQCIRESGKLRLQRETIHLLLNTGTQMRRDIRGRCIYKGILSGSTVKSDIYQKRYLSMIKKEEVDRKSESYCSLFEQSCIPNISPILALSTFSASSIIMARFEDHISRLVLISNESCVDVKDSANEKSLSQLLPYVILLRSTRRSYDHIMKQVNSRKRCHNFVDETALLQFDEYIEQSNFTVQLFLRNIGNSLINTFESLFDDGNYSIVLATMIKLDEESIRDYQELTHLVHKAHEISKEEEKLKHEIAVIGGSIDRNRPPLVFSPFKNSPQVSTELSNKIPVVNNESNYVVPNDEPKVTKTQEKINDSTVVESYEGTVGDNKHKKRKRKEKKKRETKRSKRRDRDQKVSCNLRKSNESNKRVMTQTMEKTSPQLLTNMVSPLSPAFSSYIRNENDGPLETIHKINMQSYPETNDNCVENCRELNDTSIINVKKFSEQHLENHLRNNVDVSSNETREEFDAKSVDNIQEEFLYQNNDGRNKNLTSLEFPIPLLCSEKFLESYSQTAIELSSGSWKGNCTSEKVYSHIRFLVCDCPVVDEIDVDIELPCQSAITVTLLSSWYVGQNCSVRDLSKRLLEVTATGRYRMLIVILSVDIPLSQTVTNDIAILQNSLIVQSGNPCSYVNIQFTHPSSLGYVIGSRVLDTITMSQNNVSIGDFSWIESCATDVGIQERVRFLLQIAPSMTALLAFECIRCYYNVTLLTFEEATEFEAGSAMSCFFQHISRTNRSKVVDIVRSQGVTCVSERPLIQLILAINVSLSIKN